MPQKHHAIVCKECGADLIKKSSVIVSPSDFPLRIQISELNGEGLLIDQDRVVENGYHAGTFCCACGTLCDELHHPDVKHHDGGGEG